MSASPTVRALILTAGVVAGVASCVAITGSSDGISVRHGLSSMREGSGVLRRETREVGAFTAVRLDDALDLEITVGGETQVVVEADDNLLPLIDSRVDDGVLVLASHGSYQTRHRAVVRVRTPHLRDVALNGSGDVDIRGLEAGELRLGIRGSGDIRATGRIEKLEALIEGSGDLRLGALRAEEARVRIDGSGDAEVNASRALDALVNGSGDIRYRGEPRSLRRRVEGSGDIVPG